MRSLLQAMPVLSGRAIAAAVLLLLICAAALASPILFGGAVAVLGDVIERLRGSGAAGVAAFVALQVLVTLSGVVPASLLGVAAGLLYGVEGGFVLAAIGNQLGAMIAFLLSRTLLRTTVERWVSRRPRWQTLQAAVACDGWRLVCLLRLSPVTPFSVTSYLLGLSGISPSAYFMGTLASLVALFGYVLVGAMTDAGLSVWASGNDPVRWVVLGIGGVATLVLVVRLGRIVLQRQVAGALTH